MSLELVFGLWPPLRLARVCREHVSVVVVLPAVLPLVMSMNQEVGMRKAIGRAIGLDAHRDFCEVAIGGGGPGPFRGPGGHDA